MDSFRETGEESDTPIIVSGSKDEGVMAWFGSSSTSITAEPQPIEMQQPKKKLMKRVRLPSFLSRKKEDPNATIQESSFHVAVPREEVSLLASNEPLSSADDDHKAPDELDTDSSVDSEIRENRNLVVPKLDLSSLETGTEPQIVYNKPGSEQRFKNIKYEVVKETPTTSSRTSIPSVGGSGRSDRENIEIPVYSGYPVGSTNMAGNETEAGASSNVAPKSNMGEEREGSRKKRTSKRKTISKRKRGKRPNKFMKFINKVFRRVSNNGFNLNV